MLPEIGKGPLIGKERKAVSNKKIQDDEKAQIHPQKKNLQQIKKCYGDFCNIPLKGNFNK